ncbi:MULTISPECIES: GntR family transcriptional regulator [unclassified Amycolatopsis]|uniref:GntR family transcriptional regulator n=1 Tax=unclassified Amycolatopsis TaxID=2618356 RepID=UPI001C695748|nr:GntR family transcriptional regulator [Amycolatopsis sp. DSM 110486]QYN18374.1 GntR family transcriptional regulator [Amycolatopsis sp. DSM 110486]
MKSEEVELHLRERLLRGDFTPGSRLPEVKLAAELGTTRNAVRSALLALESRKLVERIPNVGTVVAKVDFGRLEEIYDVLEVMEGLAARLAAQQAEQQDWKALQELFAPSRLDDAAASGDLETFLAAIDSYRDTVIRLAEQDFLAETLAGIQDQAHLLRRRILMTPGRMEESLAEHRDIIEALVRGDAVRAEELKRHNMKTARKRLRRYRDFLV